VISFLFESRTRAIFRSAEFGFFGVIVFTWVQTPRLKGHFSSTGLFDLRPTGRLPSRTSWFIVGMSSSFRLLAFPGRDFYSRARYGAQFLPGR
jgi:hypothetical protein